VSEKLNRLLILKEWGWCPEFVCDKCQFYRNISHTSHFSSICLLVQESIFNINSGACPDEIKEKATNAIREML